MTRKKNHPHTPYNNMCETCWPKKSKWQRFWNHPQLHVRAILMALVLLALMYLGILLAPPDKRLIQPVRSETSPLAGDFAFLGESVYTPEFRARMTYTSTLTANAPIPKPNLTEIIEKTAKSEHLSAKLLVRIAECESSMRMWNPDGSVLRGKTTPMDIGLFQISAIYHLDNSKKRGYNIFELEGNIGYAIWLMNEYGTQPWNASSKCWL